MEGKKQHWMLKASKPRTDENDISLSE